MSYDSTNIFRIWVFSRRKIIKTRNVIFNHSKFYDSIELNLAYLLTLLVESIIEILNFSKTKLIFNQHNLKDEYDEIIEEIKKSSKNSSIKNNESEFNEKKKSQLTISTFEFTFNRILTSNKNFTLTSNKKSRRIIDVSLNVIIKNTRSRKQIYATILKSILNLLSYYSKFVVNLIFSKFETKARFYKNFLLTKLQHWHQMLKHWFVRKFQLIAVKEIKELKKQKTYQLIEKKTEN